ncbi:hypothetical protein WUBG_12942 [Wuchereria bancrofti]|uniref:Uncharacterized protein n=1 Tax=Wuchereria bancrofti TaxID=6293 RepID=J9APA9_WUCBA|nr:hypothetical protein WUBG_12942 [Wuchereria bancrofti]
MGVLAWVLRLFLELHDNPENVPRAVIELQAPSPFGSNLLQLMFADGGVTLRAEKTGCQGGDILLESCESASSTEECPFVGRTSA